MSVISTLLLVQADPDLRAGLSFGFEREGIEVITAGRDDDIARAVMAARPQLVVAGARAEDEGIKTLAALKAALESAKIDAPVLYVGNGIKRERAISEGAAEVIDGRGFVRDIVTLGRLLASRNASDQSRCGGQLCDHFGLFYLMRAVSNARRRCVLTLVRGLRRGELRFYDGEVTSASVGVLHGLAALHQLLLWTDASFDLQPEEVVHRRQIPLQPMEVIANAERFLVEVREVADGISPAFVFESNPDADPDLIDHLPRQIGSVLRLFDGSRKVADVIEDSPFRMFETLRVAKKLSANDIIRRAGGGGIPAARAALSIEEWLSGASSLPSHIETARSEPIGPVAGEPASPPKKNKKKRRKNKRKTKEETIQVVASTDPAPSPRMPRAIDWSDVLPSRAATEPGSLSQVVPSKSRAGVIGVVPHASVGDESERPSVLVSAAATEAPRPQPEGGDVVGKLFISDEPSSRVEDTSEERSALARRSGESIEDLEEMSDADAAEIEAEDSDPEAAEEKRRRTRSTTGEIVASSAAASDGAISTGESSVEINLEEVREAEADEAAAAVSRTLAEAARAQAAQAEAARAAREAEQEAESRAEREAERERRALEAAEAVRQEKARLRAEKAEKRASARAAKEAAREQKKLEKKIAADAARAAKAEKTRAEREASEQRAREAATLAAASAAELARREAAEAKRARKEAAEAVARAEREALEARRVQREAEEAAELAKQEAAHAAELAAEANGSLKPVATEPSILLSDKVERIAADGTAFSDAEEAFFRAGKDLDAVPPPDVESFDDLDDGYDLPKSFWQRLIRDPNDTGRKRGDDD